MIHLLNSAMMPQEGIYVLREILPHEFRLKLLDANGNFKSYVGYENTAQAIEDLTGVEVPISRERTELGYGDEILVARLKYRVDPVNKAGPQKALDPIVDLEYFHGNYYELDQIDSRLLEML